MFRSYIRTAWRSLFRHKGASLIKLAGLSIGMCCCLLILVYLTDELSFNRFHAHYSDIYRVNFIKNGDEQFRKMAGTPVPGGPAIAKDIPQAAAVARLYTRGGILAAEGGGAIRGVNGVVAGGGEARTGSGAAGRAVKRFQEPNINF